MVRLSVWWKARKGGFGCGGAEGLAECRRGVRRWGIDLEDMRMRGEISLCMGDYMVKIGLSGDGESRAVVV